MPSHSTVTYVEPNIKTGLFSATTKDIESGYELDIWHPDDGFDRAPRLENYCIALNLEVEISSRDSQGRRDVLILQWSGDDKNKGVSFMGGTKIGGYDTDGNSRKARLDSREYLTTYYSDMYVGDLVDYGTTEMIGIKSVNIEYAKSCVPVISIKFTDVRGLSLFQPTELSRNNSYDGIKGLNRDNVAQSFFQCFFKMPLPKFTIYIKGFYGKPVAYVMMCDKFDTNFNSETGDYDVDTRFVGYSYSFLTDISFDAILAAPYSDFEGKKYWDENVNNQRFFLWDRYHTKKMPMPTLYEIHSEFKKLIKTSASGMLETTLTNEELSHEDEINSLREIKGQYQKWYQELFNLLKEKYNKRYCFDFKDSQNEDSDWFRILILTNNKTSNVDNLSAAYEQYPESFKKTNDDLYAAIEEFNNNSNSYKKLENISKDFSKYTRIKLFNDCYVNSNTREVEFGGFNRECKLNKTQIVNRLFYGEQSDYDILENNALNKYYNGNENAENELKEIQTKRSGLKAFTLSTIYNDGVDQFKDAYIIDVDYSDIDRRIKVLEADAKKSIEEKEKSKRRKEHNDLMMSQMNWYPSVENFMKVVMAHIETYMMMMYRVKEECANRTPEEMGITLGANGNASDVNPNSKYLTPFPRITKEEIRDDGTQKTVDAWVGDFDGKKRFIEADLINGLFNAVEYLQELVKQDAENAENTDGQNIPQINTNPIIKHPLTSYDFFLTKNPYGSDSDIANNPNAFAGKVAMRMFNILSLNNFKKEYGDKWSFSNPQFLEQLGEMEAENFHHCVSISNKAMLQMLGVEGGEAIITPDAIIECVINNTPIGGNNVIPWKNKDEKLFDKTFWLNRYTSTYGSTIYPIQNMSFNALDNTLVKFNKGANSIDVENQDIFASKINAKSNVERLYKSKNSSCFGNLYISDDYKSISNILESSCLSTSNTYKSVYDLIRSSSTFDTKEFQKMIYPNGVFRPKRGVVMPKELQDIKGLEDKANTLYLEDDKKTKIAYGFDRNKLETYVNEAENKSITSWFFTECRGFKFNEENKEYQIDLNSSFFTIKGLNKKLEKASWNTGIVDTSYGFFLLCMEAINYEVVANILGGDKTFTYLPKLAVLQIGAALASLPSIDTPIVNVHTFASRTVLPRTFHKIVNYLARISYSTRIAYIKYFRDWVLKYNADINANLFRKVNNNVAAIYHVGENSTRTLFKQDSSFSQGLADNLMIPIVVTKGNVNHYRDVKRKTFSDATAKMFLNGFLSRLSALYGGSGISTSSAVKLAAEPNKTTDDMKRELYRYMKLVYEKWVPAMSKDEWRFETFFDINEEKKIINNNAGGHLFHFIDSYYNKIGDKLLINPMGLSEIIDNALSAQNTNIMALGFIADVLTKNKAMLLCLQNFQDLAESSAMEMMFRPLPYNSIREINKHPDFVILYPYEPSKYLNVDNGEFVNDSFMLNDEFDTPLAIKSRGGDNSKYYQIPAFGVSYGKQYQSYFKKVNVGMQSPIATQQALMAKHAILRKSQDSNTQSTTAQDLFDVYSTQSYTCTVEMMGCAWVQPLMYFVLTNVPLFKGSYLIFKVTHQITPGNMITTFQGTRMANVANRLVDEIFTDEDLDMSSQEYYDTNRRHALANVDNNCPYKVYPLFEDENIKLTQDELQNANNAITMLMSSGFTKAAAAGVCGNIFKESAWKLHATNGIGAFGLCQWTNNGGRKDRLIKTYGEKPTFAQQMKFIAYEWQGGDSIANKHFTELNQANLSPESAAELVCKWFERPGKSEADVPTRKMRAKKYFNNYQRELSRDNTIKPNNQDVYNAFLNALQDSLASTNSNVVLEKDKSYNNANVMRIRQKGGDNDKMDLVFDIILNGYYDYVQRLSWVIKKGGKDYLEAPSYIDVTVSKNVKPNERLVTVYHDGNKVNEERKKFGDNGTIFNQSLLKSLYKRYGVNTSSKKEIPQFNNFDIFKSVNIQDCNVLISNGSLQAPSEISPSDKGFIDGWNVGLACATLISNSKAKSGHKCAAYVEIAIAAGGGPLKNKMDCGTKGDYATNLRYNNILEKNNFVMIDNGVVGAYGDTKIPLQSGDVAIIGDDAQMRSTKFHACMYCSKGWISDFRQLHMNPYDKSYPYAIYRYKNKKKV